MGRSIAAVSKGKVIFAQGDPATAVYYIQEGCVKLSVVSDTGKEAVIAMLEPGVFFGEGCLAAQVVRMATATTMSKCSIARLEKNAVVKILHREGASRIEEDLVDRLFNSSEKRLARVLLLMADFGKDGKTEQVIPKISQAMLARDDRQYSFESELFYE